MGTVPEFQERGTLRSSKSNAILCDPGTCDPGPGSQNIARSPVLCDPWKISKITTYEQGWAGSQKRSGTCDPVPGFEDRKYRVPEIFFLKGSHSTAFLTPKKAIRSRSSRIVRSRAENRARIALFVRSWPWNVRSWPWNVRSWPWNVRS